MLTRLEMLQLLLDNFRNIKRYVLCSESVLQLNVPQLLNDIGIQIQSPTVSWHLGMLA